MEKFAINSVISATHTSEMEEEDQKEIIKKIKTSGKGDDDVNVDVNVDTGNEDEPTGDEGNEDKVSDNGDEESGEDWPPTEENFGENLKKSKKSSIFENKLKSVIMKKLDETFNLDTAIDEVLGDTTTKPQKPEEETITKPRTDEPETKPRPRRERIWSPAPGESPDPKAKN